MAKTIKELEERICGFERALQDAVARVDNAEKHCDCAMRGWHRWVFDRYCEEWNRRLCGNDKYWLFNCCHCGIEKKVWRLSRAEKMLVKRASLKANGL